MAEKQPKRVVITGASSGIGAATAEAFAKNGGRLVLAARSAEGLEDVAARCRSAGGEAVVVVTDVTDAAAVAALAKRAQTELDGIDVWFSNVGIGAVGRFTEVPIEAHRKVIEANLLGHIHDAHAALPIFLAQGRGVFVNMISVGGFVATPFAAAYSASKYGLRGLSEALRGEMAKHRGIHICDVYPSFVDTPGLQHAGNYTGGKLSVPPGVLNPRTVAKAVVRLADRPRPTTVIGASSTMVKLTSVAAPNFTSGVMARYFDHYFAKADRVPQTGGSLFAPREGADGIDGGLRRPEQRRTAAIAAGGLGLAALAAGGVALWRRSEGRSSGRS